MGKWYHPGHILVLPSGSNPSPSASDAEAVAMSYQDDTVGADELDLFEIYFIDLFHVTMLHSIYKFNSSFFWSAVSAML